MPLVFWVCAILQSVNKIELFVHGGGKFTEVEIRSCLTSELQCNYDNGWTMELVRTNKQLHEYAVSLFVLCQVHCGSPFTQDVYGMVLLCIWKWIRFQATPSAFKWGWNSKTAVQDRLITNGTQKWQNLYQEIGNEANDTKELREDDEIAL